MGFILFITAYVLFLPISFINFLFVRNKGYFKDSAINIDKFGNREFRTSLNATLIHENSPFKFGNMEETIYVVFDALPRFSLIAFLETLIPSFNVSNTIFTSPTFLALSKELNTFTFWFSFKFLALNILFV